jgi:hypothetical protein
MFLGGCTALRTYLLRLAVTAQDPVSPISFIVNVSAGRTPVAFKQTSTASGVKANIALRIRPPRSARSLRIALTTTDALGNTSSSSQAVKLG